MTPCQRSSRPTRIDLRLRKDLGCGTNGRIPVVTHRKSQLAGARHSSNACPFQAGNKDCDGAPGKTVSDPDAMKIRIIQLLGVLAVLVVLAGLRFWPERQSQSAGGTDLSRLAAELQQLESREERIEETVWGKELLAQHCGRVVEELWESINAAPNKLELLAGLNFKSIIPGDREKVTIPEHRISLFKPAGPGPKWYEGDWRDFLNRLRRDGWELGAVEFRHRGFEVDGAGHPRHSRFYCAGQLANPTTDERATIQGELGVEWGPQREDGLPTLRRLDASRLTIATRSGPLGFQPILSSTIQPPKGSYFIDPLIAQDLDGDGLPEIILAASNTIFRRNPDGGFTRTNLCRDSPGLIFTAVMADLDGDGIIDFLCARRDGLHLFRGSARGTFDEPGRAVWVAEPRLQYGQVLTCGDVDGDGDLDLWLGQYKPPYERGQMPTPYYAANDGYPAWLLLNNGHGEFSDATEASGLSAKRFRRTVQRILRRPGPGR